jgi:hypothetical protein
MTKIVQAMNAMIQHPENISKVTPTTGGNTLEYFFLYKDYKWSINCSQPEDSYNLFYYPGGESIENLAALEYPDSEQVTYIRFSSKDIGTKEALSTFQELYQTIQARLYRIDVVLEDIIKDEIPF